MLAVCERGVHPAFVLHPRALPSMLVGLLALLSASCTNFHVVEEGRVYRSAQPEARQLRSWIWRYDLGTVVRLRGGGPERESYRASRDPALASGADFVHIPLSAIRFPDQESLAALCDVFENGRYPVLFHCMAGADRTGLASAAYMLHRTGELREAREELAFIPYLHTGLFGADKADLVLDMYEPWAGVLTFCEWVRTEYESPGDAPSASIPEGYFAEQEAKVAAKRAQMVADDAPAAADDL